MNNLNLRKKVFILATTSLLVLSVASLKGRVYNPEYTINQSYTQNDPETPFATYKDNDIYIGSLHTITKSRGFGCDDDVYVVDQRKKSDPNMCVIDSYKISKKEDMEAVIEVLQDYNDLYPSDWERTTESMLNEWEIHNICKSLNIKPDSTESVDLNNGDECIYKSKILTKILDN